MFCLDLRDDLDLAERARRQRLDGEAGTGGFARKVACVDLIECGEVRDVREEAGRLDNACEIRAGGCEHGAEVFADLLCLRVDCSCRDLARSGINADLSRGIDEIADPHGLAIWAEGGGGVGAVDYFHFYPP